MGYLYTPESALFMLADGMGGHVSGELAAQIALETMAKAFQAQAHPVIPNPPGFLSKTLLQAHHDILSFGSEAGMEHAPRTTLVALLVQAGQAVSVHCGDSRLYWVRDDKMLKRTLDHSYVEQGPLPNHPSSDYLIKLVNRNVLYTCLGSPVKPIYEVSASMSLERGDKFLLCSDGLWGALKDEEVISTLAAQVVTQSVPRLIEMALHKGGRYGDNVTGIGVEWHGE